MSCSLKAVAQDILLSREAYRNFVCSARSVATKNSYTKTLQSKFVRWGLGSRICHSDLQLISGIVPTREGEIGRTLDEILISLIIFRRLIFIKFIHISQNLMELLKCQKKTTIFYMKEEGSDSRTSSNGFQRKTKERKRDEFKRKREVS